MIVLALALASGCIAVDGEHIRAADLAAAVPEFAQLAPETELAYSPIPGVRRTVMSGELQRWASQHGLKLEGGPSLCIQRETSELTRESVLEALRTAIANDSARIELVDFSRYPVPKGDLEFPRSGYTAPLSATQAVVWRGRVRTAGNRSTPVWARVRIAVSGKRLVAADDLPAGKPITAAQVRVEESELPLQRGAGLVDPQQAVGKVPLRSIRAGSPLVAMQLTAPPEVSRGDNVEVRVLSGAAQLNFQASAESAGRRGDLVMLRNPESGKRFQARVEGQGKVTVDAKIMSVPASASALRRGPGGSAKKD